MRKRMLALCLMGTLILSVGPAFAETTENKTTTPEAKTETQADDVNDDALKPTIEVLTEEGSSEERLTIIAKSDTEKKVQLRRTLDEKKWEAIGAVETVSAEKSMKWENLIKKEGDLWYTYQIIELKSEGKKSPTFNLVIDKEGKVTFKHSQVPLLLKDFIKEIITPTEDEKKPAVTPQPDKKAENKADGKKDDKKDNKKDDKTTNKNTASNSTLSRGSAASPSTMSRSGNETKSVPKTGTQGTVLPGALALVLLGGAILPQGYRKK